MIDVTPMELMNTKTLFFMVMLTSDDVKVEEKEESAVLIY